MGAHGKVGHVGQEGVDLDDLADGRAGLLEDGLEVGDAGGRLLLDGALDQVALGVAGDLAGAVDGGGGLDGLGLRDRSGISVSIRGSGPWRKGQCLEVKTYVRAGGCGQAKHVSRASTRTGQHPLRRVGGLPTRGRVLGEDGSGRHGGDESESRGCCSGG